MFDILPAELKSLAVRTKVSYVSWCPLLAVDAALLW